MAERFVEVDRNTPMLLPADLRDWVPEDDLVHFVIEAVKSLPISEFVVNERGSGHAQYPPSMMLALLIYCYANGIFSSRRIERATYRDLGQNHKLIARLFVRVLELARELKLFQVGTISVDGTRLKANASKHRGVSYERSGQLLKQLEGEVQELLTKAERADSRGELDPAQLPQQIAKRQELQAKLQAARQQLEERHRQDFAAQVADYEKKKAAWERNNRRGTKPRPPLSQGPDPGDQSNLSNPDSRIMRKSKNEAFAQAYNAQLAVDAEGSQLILGVSVSQSWADNNELQPMIARVSHNLDHKPQAVLADSGYVNGAVIEQIQAEGIEVYVALSAEAFERRPYDLRAESKRRENPRPRKAPVLVAMEQKLRTPEGRRSYLRRQASVEPALGIIKKVLGFEQFLLRGLPKVSLEWELVCVAYNLKRLHRLLHPPKPKPEATKPTQPTLPIFVAELSGPLFSLLTIFLRTSDPPLQAI